MEVRKVEMEKIFKRYKEDEIPTNWYFPARKMYSFCAWMLNEWANGSKIRDKDKLLYTVWQAVEEHSIAYGKEYTDEESGC